MKDYAFSKQSSLLTLFQEDHKFSNLENIIDLIKPSLWVSLGWPTQNVKNAPSLLTLLVQTPMGYQPTQEMSIKNLEIKLLQQMGKSELIVPDLFLLINKSNGTNCKQVCQLYGGALVSEHQTNQSSQKIQENQNEIHEPNSTNMSLI